MRIFHVTIFFVLLLVLACTSKKEEGIISNEKDIANFDTTKSKIKDFWSAYRTAQNHRNNGEFLEARNSYIRALEINPQHEDALFNLGNMSYELGNYEEAEEAWKKLISVNDQNVRAHFQLGNLYLRIENPGFFNLDKAEKEFKKAANLNRVVTGPLLHLGQIQLLRNRTDSARYYFTSTTSTNAKSVEAFFHLGYLSWKDGNERKATEYFSKAIKVSEPEKAVEGVLSEGDTKSGKSLTRPINESLFLEFLKNMNEIEDQSIQTEMKNRYQNQDAFLLKTRKQHFQ